jgi:hypothetical protein
MEDSMDIKDYITSNVRMENISVYGLENSIRVAKFPMSTDTRQLDYSLTERQASLGSCIAGTGHDCFLKGIIVQFDLTLPQYIWQQMKRYGHFDIVSSQSTMHKITKMNISENCTREVDKRVIKILEELIVDYNKETDIPWKNEQFRKIVANIPSGLMLTAGISTNYLQLKTIRKQRLTHKMEEWHDICYIIDSLPKFKELVLGGE